jgi:hypothetical protein
VIGPDPSCELCRADRFTHWYFQDEHCWVADCEACSVPMVVWSGHGPEPSDDVIAHCLARLAEAADLRFGPGAWSVDRHMRQVPEHFHAHARDKNWWQERWSRPLSRYSGVGGERRLVGDGPTGSA